MAMAKFGMPTMMLIALLLAGSQLHQANGITCKLYDELTPIFTDNGCKSGCKKDKKSEEFLHKYSPQIGGKAVEGATAVHCSCGEGDDMKLCEDKGFDDPNSKTCADGGVGTKQGEGVSWCVIGGGSAAALATRFAALSPLAVGAAAFLATFRA